MEFKYDGPREHAINVPCMADEWFRVQDTKINEDWLGPEIYVLEFALTQHSFEVYKTKYPGYTNTMFLQTCLFIQAINDSECPCKGYAMKKLFPHLLRELDDDSISENWEKHVKEATGVSYEHAHAHDKVDEEAFYKATANCLFAKLGVKPEFIVDFRSYIMYGESFPPRIPIDMIASYIHTMSNSIRFLSIDGLIPCLSEYEIRWSINKRCAFTVANELNPVSSSTENLCHALGNSRDNWLKIHGIQDTDDDSSDDSGKKEHEGSKQALRITTSTVIKDNAANYEVVLRGSKRKRRMLYKQPRMKSLRRFFIDLPTTVDFDISKTKETDVDVWSTLRENQVKLVGCSSVKVLLEHLVELKEQFGWTMHESTAISKLAVLTMEEYTSKQTEYELTV